MLSHFNGLTRFTLVKDGKRLYNWLIKVFPCSVSGQKLQCLFNVFSQG